MLILKCCELDRDCWPDLFGNVLGGQDWEKAEVLKACLAISLHPIDADALNNFLFRSVQFIPLLFKQLILSWLALDPSSEGKQSYIYLEES